MIEKQRELRTEGGELKIKRAQPRMKNNMTLIEKNRKWREPENA